MTVRDYIMSYINTLNNEQLVEFQKQFLDIWGHKIMNILEASEKKTIE